MYGINKTAQTNANPNIKCKCELTDSPKISITAITDTMQLMRCNDVANLQIVSAISFLFIVVGFKFYNVILFLLLCHS